MNKYLNTLLVATLAILTTNISIGEYNIGLILYIPIVFFLSKQNEKNIYLLFPISLLSCYFYTNPFFIKLLLVYVGLIVYILLSKKKKNEVNDCIFLLILNILLFSTNVTDINSILIYFVFSIFSVLIYSYFIININGVMKKRNNYLNYGYIEVVIAFIVFLGANTLNYNVNIALFVAMFYAMYLSSNSYFAQSFIYSMVITFMYLNNGSEVVNMEVILLPIISALYTFRNLYSSILLVTFCMLGWIFSIPYIAKTTLQTTIFVSLFFELFKSTILSVNNQKSEVIEDIYSQIIENVNNEVIGFAGFLDLFARDFSESKEYTQKISMGINNLISSYCTGCYLKSTCYKINKSKLYTYFKNMILYSKRSETNIGDNDMVVFMKKCIYAVEMRKSAMVIYDKLALGQTHTRMQTLIAQVNGISSILRQYATDGACKNIYSYNVFTNIRKAINDYGYNVCFFNVKKAFIDDFLLEIGIRSSAFMEVKEIIETICNNYITIKTTVVYQKTEGTKIYINVIPKINYLADCGHGAIASGDNLANGDNYLIKDNMDNKLVVAISDGMGKGYIANQESKNTLRLVQEITNLSLSTEAALQILNTFYFIQDYLEKYSTLDFLEVDKTRGEATFYKMGATTSYIFHKNGANEKIENNCLPFGIEEITERKTFKIEDGDLIVMASDGIFENIKESEDLEQYILALRKESSQNISYEILNYSRKHAKIAEDDMSIVVVKIEKVS